MRPASSSSMPYVCAWRPSATRGSGNKAGQPAFQRRLVLHLALPDSLDAPAFGRQGGAAGFVPQAVPGDLAQPVVAIGFRHARAAGAIVPVPETAVDEDGELSSRKDDV